MDADGKKVDEYLWLARHLTEDSLAEQLRKMVLTYHSHLDAKDMAVLIVAAERADRRS